MIKRPSMLIDKELALKKIEDMASKAKASGVRFRPHFKTHHSAEIGEWFRSFGVSSIAVSSVEMASYFAGHGWKDIMICVPANVLEVDEMSELSKEITLHLVVDSLETVSCLGEGLGEGLGRKVRVWIEIDVGYMRTGVSTRNRDELRRIAEAIKQYQSLILTGVLTHAGHSYHASTLQDIKDIHYDTASKMGCLKEFLNSEGFHDIQVSVGDTPPVV